MSVSEQCNHILMLPRWRTEISGSGEVPMGTTVTRSGEAMLTSESPVTSEALVEPESPGREEAKVRTRVTRIMSVPVGNRMTMSR